MKIQAAVLFGVREPFRIETVELGEPRAGEVLVKMAAAGICRSDWHLVTGATRHPLPVVPGHEGAGRVEGTGPAVEGLAVGDLVTLNWAPACGRCYYCRAGKPNLCATCLEPVWSGGLLDGTTRLSLAGQRLYHFCALAAMAEYAVVPAASCVKMDSRLPPTVAALIGCAVATGVGAVLNTAHLPAGSQVAVFGAGGIGLNIIQAARLAGAASVIAIEPQSARQALAGECGASHVLAPGPRTVAAIKDLCDGRGADYVFEAVGDPQVQQACVEAARPGGTIILAGLAPMDSRTELAAAALARQEKTIKGSYYGSTVPARDFPQYGKYCLDGQLDPQRLISQTYPLQQINQAYQDMLATRIARGMILFD
ncbi:MAG: alcohol dehydrogenase catalytic domain-containing protein [Planctomycetales bacterium]|nr:alcohol dehydrogenase catalytic domain-containing protein [Planctomycetales bacterium]NIM09817.1 alcohol dehydrogenase catalytic domain-containing protein [Planctomycetales bacterium]NIN09286.1 alcohol dehydrogenase catalytic domain-containing protein [Planctomycetales bacterium]NIN78389.1 alcohol dehydrogenase catalytic domain-containing protein [Planctomycetales bacterium]NIO35567.1 alcohol dehydrogenase catalytic domain-containing protein [Planctomycetales bacterium]